MTARVQILVKGIVQGVGFRPFVYSLAVRESLKGRVLNTSDGVLIDVEGEHESIERLLAAVEAHPPRLSRIESISCETVFALAHHPDFRIVVRSRSYGTSSMMVKRGPQLVQLMKG